MIWDAATGRLLRILKGHTAGMNSVLFSPDGRRLATALNDGTVRIWDVETGRVLAVLAGHGRGADVHAFSPGGRRLVTDGSNGARLWQVPPQPRGKKLIDEVCRSLPPGRRKLMRAEVLTAELPSRKHGPCNRHGLLSRVWWERLFGIG
ncbi:MAG: WD40 repeat domain-containing protein [Alphaproteobacteria bacterium]